MTDDTKAAPQEPVEDLAESRRRRDLTARIFTATETRERARHNSIEAQKIQMADADAAYEKAIAEAWRLWDKALSNG